MECDFEKTTLTFLDPVLEEVQTCEQTQQVKLPDDAPDVGQILGAWGQTVLRGKEWRGDSVSASGGVMAWVLYAPEDGSDQRWLEVWLPFQMKWDLPDGTPEGTIHIQCRTRFVDARTASARKIVVRASVAAMAGAWAPRTVELCLPQEPPEGAELLRGTYPVRLWMEAGERSFVQDEELTLPDTAPQPEKLVYYRLEPQVAECKVLSGRVVFRGDSLVHILYRSEEGRLHSQEVEVPFSQYAELEGVYGADAQAQFWLCPTSVELELDEEGRLRLRCGLTAQYVLTDRQLLTLVEDAYSPGRELEVRTGTVELPVVLETRRETLYGQQTISGQTGQVVDSVFLPDFPRLSPTEQGQEMEATGVVQVLGMGEDGRLWGSSARWEGRQSLPADAGCRLTALPGGAQIQAQGEGVKVELLLSLTAAARQELPMVTGVTLGQPRPVDPERPSLILRRAGEDRLWDIAKESGSTVEAIRRANALTDEPAPTRMLLIPILG